MRYQLAWSDTGFGQMELIVRNHPGLKNRLAAALRRLSDHLGYDPTRQGESREDDRRIAFFDPLVVDFRVVQADRRVVILSVRLRTDEL